MSKDAEIVELRELSGGPGCLRVNQVLRFVPVSRSNWWEGVKTGRYPIAHQAVRARDLLALLRHPGADRRRAGVTSIKDNPATD
jgi:hypothetical protein